MAEYRYDTVVVGGGIARLTATVYLARAGRKVLLIEKNRECGGLVNTFSHNGFKFDAGVRALLEFGGEIRTETTITAVLPDEHIVKDDQGVSYEYINLIWAADRSVLTPIFSVYQAGQWVYSPGGVPMSILTGKLAANKALKGK